MTGITASDIFPRIEAGSHGAPIDRMVTTTDGRRIITFGADKAVRIWDAVKKSLERTLRWQIGQGRVGEIVDVALHPDNRLLFVATRTIAPNGSNIDAACSLRIFDLDSGDLLGTRSDLGGILKLAIALRGQGLLILDGGRSKLRLFTLLELLDPDNKATEPIAQADVSAGASHMATCLADGRERVVITGRSARRGWLGTFDISASILTPGNRIALPGVSRPAGLACSPTWICVAGAKPPRLVVYGPDLAPLGGGVALDEAPAGMVFFSDTRVGRTCDRAITDNWLMLGGSDHVARLWYLPDIATTGAQTQREGLQLFVGSDGEWVIWSDSGFYNASRDGDRYFGFHVNQGEDQESEFLTADRFERLLHKPGVIREILRTGSEARTLANLGLTAPAIADSLPPVVECHEPGSFRVEGGSVDLEVAVRPAGSPIKRVWILRNGLPVWVDPTDRSEPHTYTVHLPLVPGENRFKFLAKSDTAKSVPIDITVNPADGSGAPRIVSGGARMSALVEILADIFARADAAIAKTPTDINLSRSVYADSAARDFLASSVRRAAENPALPNLPIDSTLTAVKPNLYALVVGVSIIDSPHGGFRNLKYADDDARAIGRALGSQKDGLFEKVKIWQLLNGKATLQGIRNALAELEKTVRARDEQKSRDRQHARDVTVVFLAGHGVQTQGDQFYFWNHDMDWKEMEDTGLSFIELGEIVTSFPTELLFLIDACHAEMAGGAALSGIRPDELSKRLVAINEGAQTILSAAGKDQLAEETSQFRHGFFTSGVLSVLANSVDEVSNMALAEGTMRAVEILSDRRQVPSMRVFGDLHRWILFRPLPAASPRPPARSKQTRPKVAPRPPGKAPPADSRSATRAAKNGSSPTRRSTGLGRTSNRSAPERAATQSPKTANPHIRKKRPEPGR